MLVPPDPYDQSLIYRFSPLANWFPVKSFLVASAIAALGIAPAAAGSAARSTTEVAPTAPSYSWTGFYLGVNVGGSIGRSHTNSQNPPAGVAQNETTYLSAAGAIGGGQIGYNWQVPNLYGLVLGAEADIQGSARTDTVCPHICYTDGRYSSNLQQKIGWFGTARGRIGVATGPVLSYITGGFAYGSVKTDGRLVDNFLPGVSFSLDQTRGGYVLGSGVEASLGGHWTGKLEYLHVDLGTQAPPTGSSATVSSRVSDNIFRGGLNYRFGGKSVYSAPIANWAGFYIGVNAGSLIARNQSTNAFANTPGQTTFNLAPDGFTGGAQIGYNWQSSAWVFGVEADIQGANSTDDSTCLYGGCTVTPLQLTAAFNQKIPYFGTVRGRLGYSIGSTLFYGTAGFAYGQTKTTMVETASGNAAQVFSFKHNKAGYAVGGGIESPLGLFGPAWTVKSEYLFVNLGQTSDTFYDNTIGSNETFTSDTREHIFRVSLNYHFTTSAVTKY